MGKTDKKSKTTGRVKIFGFS